MSQESTHPLNGSTISANGIRKYKIGKVKQTPTVQIDDKTGISFIQLKAREDEKIYGCTKFLNHYKEEEKLGQGTFGEVYKGIHLETQRQVAMKKIIINMEKDLFPITAQREITILKKLNHRNVIKLLEMVYDFPPLSNTQTHILSQNDPSSPKLSKNFYMILPYMVADLSGVLHNPRMNLQMSDIKNMMLQILEGLNYIHCSKFMHRDIKTANILIDHNGILKIADFGLARLYYGPPPNLKYPGGAGSGAKYTSVVVTRWYRAPELVLGDKYYTTAVDIWGVGCVFAEFFEKKPILQGTSDIDQGHVIFKLMGTPTEEDWRMAKYLPGKELLVTNYKSTLRERFGKYLDNTGLNFLEKLLALDPMKRYTTMAAKLDPFFKEEPLPSERLILPCEESHEADIKRYKEEMHQTMSQKAPTAPQGHIFEPIPNQETSIKNSAQRALLATPAKAPKKGQPLDSSSVKSQTPLTVPSAPSAESYKRYNSAKQINQQPTNGNYNRNLKKKSDFTFKSASRYNVFNNDTSVSSNPASRYQYKNEEQTVGYSNTQNNQNRYHQNQNYSRPTTNFNQYHNNYNNNSNTPIQIEKNSRYPQQDYRRYNKNIINRQLPKADNSVSLPRNTTSRQQSSQSSIGIQPPVTSRYQPTKSISNQVRSKENASLFNRVVANPIQELENVRKKSYQPRSYSFKYTKRGQNSNEQNVSEEAHEEHNDSDANLADFY
ncbi:cyclin-dependent serine/threonine protein kinase SGV1 PWA37_004496 [Arxiozyma heterogenica]|uniref:Serine/threonine-protein kinase BUR1 n=1 Tax=Arxiozyma heterogenica TaxID=278026 RepID=A0AAN7WQF5_9SACH|nr:hypothetical protein RI543_000784 [Kazachstania heterogenica]